MLTKKQKRNNWILTVVLLIVSLLFLFPVIWMLANSFKPDAAITLVIFSLIGLISFFFIILSLFVDTVRSVSDSISFYSVNNGVE